MAVKELTDEEREMIAQEWRGRIEARLRELQAFANESGVSFRVSADINRRGLRMWFDIEPSPMEFSFSFASED